MKDKILPKLPRLSIWLGFTISLFLSIRALCNYLFLMIGQFLDSIPTFILFGDPTTPGLIGFILSTIWLIIIWLVSTKFEKFQSRFWRIVWFWNMFIGILFHYLWLITAPVYNVVLPYLGERINSLDIENIWYAIAVGDSKTLLITIVYIPTIVMAGMLMWLGGQYSQYSTDIKEAFLKFEFKNSLLQKAIKIEKTEHWPDVVLGPNSDTKELVIQPGRDRTLNNIIIGSIGTGKTAALVLPILNQDLHWMSKFINDYPLIYQREDFDSEEVKGMYLNGISIIEPSNDLCKKAFQLVKAHGIPEESVFYIDPTNPNTPSINPMQGPVDKVAEAFAMVIEGLAEGSGSNDFFKQSERNHLKHYIYLLKLHDPEQEVTFDMLLNMYNNPQLVRRMHLKLKETFPKDIESIENRDERNHWAIVKQIDEWFDMNLLPKTSKVGGVSVAEKVTHGEYRGEDVYYDAKAEYVQGLRNVLNDIGANPLIRRVLFGKSNFDFDKHLEMGGVLLVNTAKGELAGLSNILGKLVLLSLQNAVFRRKPNISTFHHILVDEFPDYIYQPFREFPAQSRKYKTIVTVVAQTVTQLADKYGEYYMHTLLGTLRHKMVYGDIPDYDAQLFSKIFGEKETYEEGISEQAVSPLQEQPVLRMGNSYQRKKDAILSPSDIIYQKRFQCAVKIVSNNEPLPVMQIEANFVPKEEFKEATVIVDKDAARVWLDNRKRDTTEFWVEEGIEAVEEEPPVIHQIVEEDNEMEEVEELISFPQVEQPVRINYIGKVDVREETCVTKEVEHEETKEEVINGIDTIFEEKTEHPGNREDVAQVDTQEKSSQDEAEEMELFSIANLLGKTDSSNEPEPKKVEYSELEAPQLELADEIIKEVEKVSVNVNKPIPYSFYDEEE
ncbi:type IV secretory system conjugative DNA transfer family protein [Neobacillus sp.]|uniref:type IV secretory system conjugative DNA transfer family protein n=1 Tax=Neobacillus sp. TaxID=2675273 RepID=UPI0035B51E0B